jgi:hypothetical protein
MNCYPAENLFLGISHNWSFQHFGFVVAFWPFHVEGHTSANIVIQVGPTSERILNNNSAGTLGLYL